MCDVIIIGAGPAGMMASIKESLNNKGIYYVAEILDVHGHTGGYNITIALSTGYVAGSDIYERTK